ncbi:MAG: stage III sporulation protein AE [Oscillospiraceae bacterium]|jgi:stage III sporulation protein AE|nr:stage III sporulation protein AE [Oscillospiraceae bacterium]
MKKLLLGLLIAVALSGINFAFAYELPPELAETAPSGVPFTSDFPSGVAAIWEEAKTSVTDAFTGAVRSCAIILTVALLVGLCGVLETSGGVSNYAVLAGILAVSLVAVGDVHNFVGLARGTLTSVKSFADVILPALAAAAAASGSPASAAAACAVTAMFMDILITLSQGLLLPIIYAYLTAELIGAAANSAAALAAASFLKWLSTALLSLIVLAFILYLSITGIVSSSADAAAVRVAKTTLSTTLPVVGGIVSDAAQSVLAGALTLKNAVGVFGMLAVLAICVTPFIHIGAHYLLYKAAAKLSGNIAGGNFAAAVNGIGGAFGLLLGTSGACALMLFFSMLSLLSIRSI